MRLVRKVALTLCLMPLLLGAGVYRWVDDDGVVNYSQLKPDGIDAELVTAGTGQRSATPAPRETAASDAPADPNDDRNLTESQQEMLRDLRAAERARQQEVARIRTANCQQARDVLQRLTARGRIRVVGDDGQERVLPEEERQSRIDEAQRAVAANCSETASR